MQKPYRKKYGHLYYPDFVSPDKKGDGTMIPIRKRSMRFLKWIVVVVIRLMLPIIKWTGELVCYFEKKRELREKIKIGDTRWIAKYRIAECLRQCTKKVVAVSKRSTVHKKIELDLSGLDLTDAMLAELFEAFTGKNKELEHIACIDVSKNPGLAKLPWHIAWCKNLFWLGISDTAITEIPTWMHGIKHVTVYSRKAG
jgi:hypothetical protein